MVNLSVMGLWKYDSTVFDLLELPTALVTEKDNIISNILAECAELEIIYPQASTMKGLVGVWSHKQKPVWEKLYNTTILEYNPIWNKDGKVVEIEGTQTKRSEDKSGSLSEQNNGAATSHATTDSETENKVSAFNDAANYSPQSKNTTDGSAQTTTTSTQNNKSSSLENTDVDEKHDRTYQRIEQGNIGVTTTQSMIQEEREVDLFNIIDVIVNDFKNRFCLLVY